MDKTDEQQRQAMALCNTSARLDQHHEWRLANTWSDLNGNFHYAFFCIHCLSMTQRVH